MVRFFSAHAEESVRSGQKEEDARFCTARLRLLIDTLPVTIYGNPAGVAFACVTLYFGQSEFGHMPFWRMAVAVAVQGLAAAGAYYAWRFFPAVTGTNTGQIRRSLILLQIMIGLCWGAVGWLLWNEGNAANNTFVVTVMAMALWAMTATRCAVRAVFLSGFISLSVPLCLRFAVSDGVTAHVFLGLTPVWGSYILFFGIAARRRIDELLKARFAKEDLSAELAAARDEAVAKRQEAEAANKSKTAFLANMSHELRTPLNAIIGFSEIISSEALGPANARYPEYAGDIHNSGTHLLALINEILDVAKIEAGRMEIDPQPLDPSAVLDSVERVMAIRAGEKTLDVRYDVDPVLDTVTADERAFRQIALNLVSNAIKFTPAGGRIDVVCRPGPKGGAELAVADTGEGIPAGKIGMLFKPFSRVDNRFDRHQGGTGLGLALVHGLVCLHGGNARIESKEGVGTTVTVYFPLASIKREKNRAG